MARKTNKMAEAPKNDWLQVNEDNKELVQDFLEYCESIDRSPKTIENYESDLKIVMVWFKNNLKNKKFVDVNKRDVVKFQNWCIKQGMSPSRIRRLRSAMSSCSNYIENMLDDVYKNFRNIINKIPAPSLTHTREKTILSEKQVDKLLDDLININKIQHACFVAVLAASGMRKSEVVQTNVDWVCGDNVNIYEGMYVSPEIRTKGSGVAGKILNKYIIKDIADKYLDMWMKERDRLGIKTESLFVIKRKGEWRGIKDSTVDSWMDLFTRLTGENCYAHAFRHYAATWLKRNNVPVDVIRDFFGHNDSSTTEIYIDIGKEENLKGMLSFMNKS